MHTPLLTPSDELVCHVLSQHVEPSHGFAPDSKPAQVLHHDELLLIGREPAIKWIRGADEQRWVEELLAEGRTLVTEPLTTPAAASTHVSAVQLAVWFRGATLMAALLGRNAVNAQRWGHVPMPLAECPGMPLGQLTTLWLPLTDGSTGTNLRWRVALAYTGPDAEIGRGQVEQLKALTGGPPSMTVQGSIGSTLGAVARATGTPRSPSITFGEKRRLSMVERFRDWLSFPAQTYEPVARTLEDRPDGDPATRDARLERLEKLRDALVTSVGYAGLPDIRMVAELLKLGAFGPHDVARYTQFEDLDLSWLAGLGLLRGT